jgi:hypothetical protein
VAFSARSRGFGYSYEAVRIRVKGLAVKNFSNLDPFYAEAGI